MSSHTPSDARQDFFSIVTDLGMLSDEVARAVVHKSGIDNLDPVQTAIQQGLLDTVQGTLFRHFCTRPMWFPGIRFWD